MKKHINFILFFVFFLTGNADAYIINQTYQTYPYNIDFPSFTFAAETHTTWRYDDSSPGCHSSLLGWCDTESTKWTALSGETIFLVTSEYNKHKNSSVLSSLDVKIFGKYAGEHNVESEYTFMIELFELTGTRSVKSTVVEYNITNKNDTPSAHLVELSFPFRVKLNREYLLVASIIASSSSPSFIPETSPYSFHEHSEYIANGLINIPNEAPEPTTMLLFGAGISGLTVFGRRKRS